MTTLHQLFIKPTVDWARAIAREWDRFWFTPEQPHTLALIRILGGAMMFYTHLVWSLEPGRLPGTQWLAADIDGRADQAEPTATVALERASREGSSYAWSYLY